MSVVELAISDRIATLTLNRPEAANALNWDVVHRIEEVCSELHSMPLDAVLVRSSTKVFSAGLDRTEMGRLLDLGPEDLLAERHDFYSGLARLLRIPVPTIAVVEGAAVTGGVGIAALCDFRMATTDAWFRTTFNELGFYPGLALSVSLPAVAGRSLARRMLLLGERIEAAEAHRLGLVDWLSTSGNLDSELDRICNLVAASDDFVVRLMKDRIDNELRADVDEVLKHEAMANVFNVNTDRFRRRAMDFIG